MGAVLWLVFSAACSTPGPAHAYLFSPGEEAVVRDTDPSDGTERASVPVFVQSGEQVLGLAYEPFTDHLFLRLAPGDRVRVIDRPARAIKREFTASALPPGGHDLAVRSRDRHLFFTHPEAATLIETDAQGRFERSVPLAGLSAGPTGVAHDPVRGEFLVLEAARSRRVLRFDETGAARGEIPLELPVDGVSLGFDPDRRELYASLADQSALGVFAEDGRLLRRLPRPPATRDVLVDVGRRALLRLF